MRKMVVCVFVLCVLLHAGYAIRCYNCISNAINDCRDYSRIPIVECTPLRDKFPPVCIRRVLKGPSGMNTTLQCTDNQTGNECDPPSNRYNVTDCIICQNDLCNGSLHIVSNYSLVITLSLSMMLLALKAF